MLRTHRVHRTRQYSSNLPKTAQSAGRRASRALNDGTFAMVSGEFHGVASGRNRTARIACILVADFALAAIMRANPELRERPFALARVANGGRSTNDTGVTGRGAGCHPHSELSQVSAQARALGVRPGMSVAQARAPNSRSSGAQSVTRRRTRSR